MYVAYSLFKVKANEEGLGRCDVESCYKLWNKIVEENLFVLCRTPIAKRITRRTLMGFRRGKANIRYVENLNEVVKAQSDIFAENISKASFWDGKKEGTMKFDAIVGNPPYHEMDKGNFFRSTPTYQHFVSAANALDSRYTSFIMPARWFTGGKGLDTFRKNMLANKTVREIHDCRTSKDIFPGAEIGGGVCYILQDSEYDNSKDDVHVSTYENNVLINSESRPLKVDGIDIFIRDGHGVRIINKIFSNDKVKRLSDITSAQKPFGLRGNFVENEKFHSSTEGLGKHLKCYGRYGISGYVEEKDVPKNVNIASKWKVLAPVLNNIAMESPDDNFNSVVSEPGSICTETFVLVGVELNLDEQSAKNLSKYLRTKTARYLHGLAKASNNASSKTFKFIPVEDYSANSDIDWSLTLDEIDSQLFEKYGLSEEDARHIRRSIKDM